MTERSAINDAKINCNILVVPEQLGVPIYEGYNENTRDEWELSHKCTELNKILNSLHLTHFIRDRAWLSFIDKKILMLRELVSRYIYQTSAITNFVKYLYLCCVLFRIQWESKRTTWFLKNFNFYSRKGLSSLSKNLIIKFK